MGKADLVQKSRDLPIKPGCYLMKNKSGVIIYVGKAKNLKNRVMSYFNNSAKNPKTQVLVGHITDFDFILANSESEAFILENNLIKKHSPKYNIRLKDDASYPYVVVDTKEVFPRLQYLRKFKHSKSMKVFGPFPTGSNVFEVVRVLTKSFELRDCSLREFKARKTPCLLYQMHQCSAPCVGYISEEKYSKDLKNALSFFTNSRGSKKSLEILEEKMIGLASEEKFEHAAIIRDQIQTLEDFTKKSIQENAEFSENKNIDIIAYHVGKFDIDIAIYLVRNGILLGHKKFHFPIIDCHNEIEEEIINYLFQYYENSLENIPDLVISDLNSSNVNLLKEAFEHHFKSRCKMNRPNKKYSSIYNLTKDFAKEQQTLRLKNQESIYVGLNKLKDLLGLKERPAVLECYDVAIWQGQSPTASQIVFRDGALDKKSYRHYNLKELPEGNNDFAMMKEVLSRRIDNEELPDIFIVDGGKGQVNSFREVLNEFNISIPVVGIAKEKIKNRGNSKTVAKTEERLIISNRVNPYLLKNCQSLFRIIVSMRDEAHRFSRRLHHKKEKERTFSSWADNIKGIGPKTKEKIYLNLQLGVQELKKLNEDDLARHFDISKDKARLIFKYFN